MVRTLATPLGGRGSPKKFSGTGTRARCRVIQSGAGFCNPAPEVRTCGSRQVFIRLEKFKLSHSSLDGSKVSTKFRRNRTGYEFWPKCPCLCMEKKSKFVPRPISTKFGGHLPTIQGWMRQFEFFQTDDWLQRYTSSKIRRRVPESGAGLHHRASSSTPALGSGFSGSCTLQRRSQLKYLSEKCKFIKIGLVVAEIRAFRMPLTRPEPTY